MTPIEPNAWKGRFAVSLAMANMRTAINFLGSTEIGKPISESQFKRLRILQDQLEHEFEIMTKWGYDQAPSLNEE